MLVPDTKAEAVRALRFSSGVAAVILLGLNIGFSFAAPAPVRPALWAVQGLFALWVLWFILWRLNEARHRAGDWFAMVTAVCGLACFMFLTVPLHWLSDRPDLTANFGVLMLGLLALGYFIGARRLDRAAQAKNIARAVRPIEGGYRIKREGAKFALYHRKFGPLGETLYKIGLWVFGIIFLALTLLGGAAATVLVRLMRDWGLAEDHLHSIGMLWLGVPVLLACGYLMASVLPAWRLWTAQVRGMGAEVFPKDHLAP